jgi:hypothetical protein
MKGCINASQAHPISRAPGKNRRPNARQRAKQPPDLSYGTRAYWDLVVREDLGRQALYWDDEYDPERRAAWFAQRENLKQRWPFSWSFGRRLAGWWAFEMPVLARRAGLSAKQLNAMTDEECVWLLDSGEAEKRDIEELWSRGSIETPEWFRDQQRRRRANGRKAV